MEKWLLERLSICLDFEIPNDMIKYIMDLKNSQEFDDYFETLLNKECEDHRLFLADCKQRMFSKQLPNKKTQSNAIQQKKGPKHGTGIIKQNSSNSGSSVSNDVNSSKHSTQNQNAQMCSKKKTKYVSLYTDEGNVMGETIRLKGRRLCECQAAQHKLINNCLFCGRIVCEQEGSGPCLFCGAIVCTNDEQHVLKSQTKKSATLLKSLKEKGGGESLKNAFEQRDRLLEYDRNSEQRTTVIDDELDYFQENSVWLSGPEREKFERLKNELHEKKHAGRAKRQIKVDFAGREVDDDIPISIEYERSVLQEIANANATHKDASSSMISSDLLNIGNADPSFDGLRPVYRTTAKDKAKYDALSVGDGLERIYNRVQDKELLEMQDMRQCLSLHQPWASMLVAGIKKHEGRVWYSGHRGRLWIASTTKEPTLDAIEELKNFYKNYYNNATNIKFPTHYPTGCLLGCVNVDDCVPQEEYRENYPNGETESPYVFVCSNPEQLPVVIPIKGQHKLYEIDAKVHNTACKTLFCSRNTKDYKKCEHVSNMKCEPKGVEKLI